jgi:hypothetical protein
MKGLKDENGKLLKENRGLKAEMHRIDKKVEVRKKDVIMLSFRSYK